VDPAELIEPVVDRAGLELVDVSFARERGRRVLRVVLDRDGGVDLDTISEISERISRRLDLERFDPGPYALEVTSPGLERPLRRPDHFRRSLGEQVRMKVVMEHGSDVVTHRGTLVDADDEGIQLLTSAGELRIPYARVRSARTVIDWAAELRGSAR
jgi:ribosome maturation factor RimP